MQSPAPGPPLSQNASYNTYHQREPPPYPGNNQRNWFQPGFRQSYSGSEASTDISLSSTESLSARQEPQGQETASLVSTPIDSLDGDNPFAEHFLGPLPSSTALEIKSANSSTFYVTGSGMGGGGLSTSPASGGGGGTTELEVPTGGSCSRGSSPQGSRTPPPYQGQRSLNHSPNMVQQPPPTITAKVNTDTESVTVPTANFQSPMLQGPTLMPPGGSSPTPQPLQQQQAVMAQTQTLQVPGVSPNISPQGSFKSSPVGSLQRPPSEILGLGQLHQLFLIQQSQALQGKEGQVKGHAFYPQQHSPRMGVNMTKEAFVRSGGSTRSTKSASPTPVPTQQRPDTPTAKAATAPRPSTAPSQRPAPQPPPTISHEYHGPAVRPTTLESKVNSRNLRRSYEMLDKLPQTHSHPDLTRLALAESAALPTGHNQTQQQQQQVMTAASEIVKSVSPQPSAMQVLQQLQQQQHVQQQHVQQQHVQQQQQQQMISHQMMIQHQANTSQSVNKKKLPDLDHAAIATRATQMVERLSQENLSLRKELQSYYNKVCKLQKFENEIEKVHDAYENLVKHSQKRESLEKAMRCKLEASVNTLKHNNQQLKDQLDKAVQQLSNKELYSDKMSDSEAKRELQRKDSMLNKLISQNRDLLVAKERLQFEVATQRSTVQEQRAQISILDSALTYSQTNVLKYEEEQQRRRAEEEKVADLQKALSQLQTVTDKRQGIEQQLCAKLQEEIQVLKSQQVNQVRACDADEGISSDSESPTSVQSLIQHMQEKEQRILQLEAQVLKWEQKYLEETALRQLAVDVASMPKDARIAALEQSSLATEKIMADARTEKLKHLEEVYQANRRVAEAEAKLSSLQAQLAEKDAMIRVLQRHPTLSRTSSIASLFSSPVHSPHQSILSSSPVPSISPLSISPIPSTPFTAFSVPGSGASSRQNSHLDTSTLPTFSSGSSISNGNSHNESNLALHNKSNSTGSAGASSTSSHPHSNHTNNSSHNVPTSRETQWKELQHKLVAQAALFGSLQSGSEQLKKCFWQV